MSKKIITNDINTSSAPFLEQNSQRCPVTGNAICLCDQDVEDKGKDHSAHMHTSETGPCPVTGDAVCHCDDKDNETDIEQEEVVLTSNAQTATLLDNTPVNSLSSHVHSSSSTQKINTATFSFDDMTPQQDNITSNTFKSGDGFLFIEGWRDKNGPVEGVEQITGHAVFDTITLEGDSSQLAVTMRAPDGTYDESGVLKDYVIVQATFDDDTRPTVIEKFHFVKSQDVFVGENTGKIIDKTFSTLTFDLPADAKTAKIEITAHVTGMDERIEIDDVAVLSEYTPVPPSEDFIEDDTDSNNVANQSDDIHDHGDHMHDHGDGHVAIDPTQFADKVAFAEAVTQLADDHSAHQDDAGKAGEHHALLDLVKYSEATHVAVESGSWFNPNIWINVQTGLPELPGDDAKVVIPDALSVYYDDESDASLFTVRVDGKLEFATDRDTKLELDTLIVAPGGALEIGTIDTPVQSDVTASIIIADNGNIDLGWDPMMLSRGIVSHGAIEIHGSEKTSHLKVDIDAMAGDTSLVLNEVPTGWQVGDKLVLGSTKYSMPITENGEIIEQPNQDEELLITSIDGNVVSFDPPLQFDHDTPREDLKAYVANYTRNVVIETENGEDLPPHQRGHTMFMHSDDVDVRYAEFYELGRTDKSERSVGTGADDLTAETSVKGRYAFHFHRTGTEENDNPGIAIGNSVYGSPGWGFVNHDSNAVFENNAAYDVFGAAFVTETGNEIGAFRNNIAIWSEGTQKHLKDQQDVEAFDLWNSGVGFGFQGRLVEDADNVAISTHVGFGYMTRGELGDALAIAQDDTDFQDGNQGDPVLHPSEVPSRGFSNNEAIAARTGLSILNVPGQETDIRNVVDGFTGWEVRKGVFIEYSNKYTFKNLDLIGTDARNAFNLGFDFGPKVFDTVINNASISGFDFGVDLEKRADGIDVSDFGFVLIDVDISDSKQEDLRDYDRRQDTILSSSDLVEGRLSLNINEDLVFNLNQRNRDLELDAIGSKTDSIGTTEHPFSSAEFVVTREEVEAILTDEGYYTTRSGQNVLLIPEYYSDRATGDIMKTTLVVELEGDIPDLDGQTKFAGEIDLSSRAPNTEDEMVTTSENSAVIIDILANDTDPDSDTIDLTGIIQPKNGEVYGNADGSITYVPDSGFSGDDLIEYWVSDTNGKHSKASVDITVTPDPNAPDWTPVNTFNELEI